MPLYDVIIEINEVRVIGETTHTLASARNRMRWELRHSDGRKVEIIKHTTNGMNILIASAISSG